MKRIFQFSTAMVGLGLLAAVVTPAQAGVSVGYSIGIQGGSRGHCRGGWYPFTWGVSLGYSSPVYYYSEPPVYYAPPPPPVVYSAPASSAVVYSAPPPPPVARAAKPEPKPTPLTSADVKALVKAGVADEVIISQIRASRTVFRLSTATIIELKEAGVSAKVLDYMINTGTP